jgi:alpha-ribazole phosphatase
MLRLILARHGQTDWNTQRRYQGQTDVPLNDVGRQQAAALARCLADTNLNAIYASTLQRATSTAQAIAQLHGQPVLPEPRLCEMSFGRWSGLTFDEIQAREPETLAAWLADPMHIAPPKGETLTEVTARIRSALDETLKRHRDSTVLWVAHGGVLRVLISLALGLQPQGHWRFRISIASLAELWFYDSGVTLTRLNDTYHLSGGRLAAAPRHDRHDHSNQYRQEDAKQDIV